ncbi:histone deacetylase family protein, partial [Reticulomyxa filosa]
NNNNNNNNNNNDDAKEEEEKENTVEREGEQDRRVDSMNDITEMYQNESAKQEKEERGRRRDSDEGARTNILSTNTIDEEEMYPIDHWNEGQAFEPLLQLPMESRLANGTESIGGIRPTSEAKRRRSKKKRCRAESDASDSNLLHLEEPTDLNVKPPNKWFPFRLSDG